MPLKVDTFQIKGSIVTEAEKKAFSYLPNSNQQKDTANQPDIGWSPCFNHGCGSVNEKDSLGAIEWMKGYLNAFDRPFIRHISKQWLPMKNQWIGYSDLYYYEVHPLYSGISQKEIFYALPYPILWIGSSETCWTFSEMKFWAERLADFVCKHVPSGNEVCSIEPYAIILPRVGSMANPSFGNSMDVAYGLKVYYGKPCILSTQAVVTQKQ